MLLLSTKCHMSVETLLNLGIPLSPPDSSVAIVVKHVDLCDTDVATSAAGLVIPYRILNHVSRLNLLSLAQKRGAGPLDLRVTWAMFEIEDMALHLCVAFSRNDNSHSKFASSRAYRPIPSPLPPAFFSSSQASEWQASG